MKTGGRIMITLLSLWLSLLGLEKVYDFLLTKNKNLKLTNIQSSPPSSDLLIHGPCEPLWMLSPALLDAQTGISSYNLALSHSDFADNYLHLYQYLKYNKAPTYLLLYVTPESFDKNYNTFNSYRFAPYLSDSIVSEVVKENDPAYFKWTFIPFMKYAYYNNKFNFNVAQGLVYFLKHRKEAYYPDGFEPPTKRAWGNHNADFVKLYSENTVFKLDSIREKYLLKCIRLAKQNKIRVYLYESPVLFESLSSQTNRNDMLSKIKNIADSEQVSFIQFDNLPMAKEKKYFISTLNFNIMGVKIFNDSLAKYIRKNIIDQQP